jgi:hypothetical protein
VRGQRHAPAAPYPGKDPVHIVQGAGWAPGPVWRDAGKSRPTGIRSPDRPALRKTLYRLRYLAHVDQSYLHQYLVSLCQLYSQSSSSSPSVSLLTFHIHFKPPFSTQFSLHILSNVFDQSFHIAAVFYKRHFDLFCLSVTYALFIILSNYNNFYNSHFETSAQWSREGSARHMNFFLNLCHFYEQLYTICSFTIIVPTKCTSLLKAQNITICTFLSLYS